MQILALDTALGACSVALIDGKTVRARCYRDLTRGHAEVLMGLVSEAEEEAGFRSLACDRLAVTVGPGTFTGLRVGLAAARGLALASGLPLVGITTLQAIAANVTALETRVLTLLDAKRGEVYAQSFGVGLERRPQAGKRGLPRVLPLDAAEALVREEMSEGNVSLAGSGAPLIADRVGPDATALISSANVQPDAVQVARLAALIEDPATAPANPLYLRAPDAKLPSRNPLA